MKKFIRPFESELLNINEEESLKSKQSQLFLSPEEFEEIESRNKEIVKKSVGE
jgi:UV DNA damage repair endonuclease